MFKADPALNHSAAHLLAASVCQLFPGVKLGFGPAIKEGFYYDFLFPAPITPLDLARIEKRMHRLAKQNYRYQLVDPIDLAGQPFKNEQLNELILANQTITYYGMVDPQSKASVFSDLCKGNHVASSSQIAHFKLLSLAGAYWRGDSSRPQLTRIYGTAWPTKEKLSEYLALVAERQERDHRKIGRELEIFTFDPQVGQGLPIWLPHGTAVKNALQSYFRQVEKSFGFQEVSTPSLGQDSLYQTSGHLAHYQQDMFPLLAVDHERFVLRPMACPHHVLIYQLKLRSYRDLPLRLSEHAQLYRYEKSGALTGLERVRSMELTDAHIFARPDQIVAEFENAYRMIEKVLARLAIKIAYVSLSLHDPADELKYYPDQAMWKKAESELAKALDKLKVPYQKKIGEAAFYGPKVDIQVESALGHEITLSTLQLDFLLPEKFGLFFIDSAGKKQKPVIIHRGLVGTYERLIAILLEQTKGNLPFWLAPRQVSVIPVDPQKHLAYAEKITQRLTDLGFRVELDARDERLTKRIRSAQIGKSKLQIIVGDQEVSRQDVSWRFHGKTATTTSSLKELIKHLQSDEQD